jgi:hypothetical protein
MNAKWLVMAAALIGSASGCAYGINKAASDYNRQVNFSNYDTFFIVKGNSSGDPVADARVATDVVTALRARGWTEVPEGEGETAVVIHAATASAHTYEAFYNGWGGWRWRGLDSSTKAGDDYKVGTVVVTIFDAETKQAVWRGSAADAIAERIKDPTKVHAGAVARMFAKLPSSLQAAAPAAMANGTSAARIETPEILFSASPAVLIPIEGDPVYHDIDGTGLQRIVNTKPLILRDESGTFYLRILNGWMEAYSLEGLWSVAGVPPENAAAALRNADAAKGVDLLDGGDTPGADGNTPLTDERAPAIYITTTPAALVVTDGAPRFEPVPGTSLEYMANTTSKVFREPTDQELYLLVSGRWFRSWTTAGPWQVVPGDQLPADLARISESRLD